MTEEQAYAVLKIPIGSSEDVIKKSFRGLASKYHPDITKDDGTMMREINTAYAILTGKEKAEKKIIPRKIYNPYSRILFGIQLEPLKITLEFTKEELNNGCDKTIVYRRNVKCEKCNGIGGFEPEICNDCSGSGKTGGFLGKFCSKCNGNGYKVVNPCMDCNGEGFLNKEQKLITKFTPSKKATVKSVKGQGNFFRAKGYSDLYVTPIINEKKFDIYQELKLTFPEIMLGCKKVINGYRVSIKERTQPESILRMKDCGIDKKGDMFITIKLIVPKRKLTELELELLHEALEEELYGEV